MSVVETSDVKSKFQELQSKVQSIKDEKLGYEGQLATLQSQYDESLAKLLEETGTYSLEEAVSVCKEKQTELESLKAELESEIDKYLKTIEEVGI